jgi:hypothetical protein
MFSWCRDLKAHVQHRKINSTVAKGVIKKKFAKDVTVNMRMMGLDLSLKFTKRIGRKSISWSKGRPVLSLG